jgi:CHRD domain
MRGRQLLVMAVVATAVAACEAREEPETQETMTPPATETQPTQPEPVTGDAIARAEFQPTSTAAGREIRGTAEVRRAGSATSGTGTGTTGTGTTGTGTPGTGTGTGAAAGSGSEQLELHARLEGLSGEHAWHIHEGPCSNQQAPVAVRFSEPLRATGGTAEQTAPIQQLTPQQLESGQYSVRVHESASAGAATIACADIQRR